MAYHGYMTITGKKQGLISAGCSTQDSIGNRCQRAHADEIQVLSFTHNLLNNDNTQRASHEPVLITKHLDKATPLLAQALDTREEVQCNIKFYRTNMAGTREKYFTVSLTGGLISQQHLDMPHSVLLADQDAQEHLAIRYREISWHHHAAGTSGYATWGDHS
ncbi:MAG TPA: Hcp family type VI secretion system effector [Pseudomonas sp.]|uniref:Hcp family type VI secretion system effector n=1 Tax=Pseudomonas sp. TaxID=306 RepID=UPI002B4950AA|nr:Hcp family type VI secretion system effector [Pseudomonas sp.]HKS11654.1 Hcp family type VI secretion system effector [Pseudomonas sp.]